MERPFTNTSPHGSIRSRSVPWSADFSATVFAASAALSLAFGALVILAASRLDLVVSGPDNCTVGDGDAGAEMAATAGTGSLGFALSCETAAGLVAVAAGGAGCAMEVVTATCGVVGFFITDATTKARTSAPNMLAAIVSFSRSL